MSTRGELRLIDIRPEDERIQDGWPIDAISVPFPTGPVADYVRFVSNIERAVQGDQSHPLALVCRRGVMSRRAQAVLTEVGFRNVINISDGFLGSESGPGWKGWGLPVGGRAQSAPTAGTVQ